jgi:hypothetical protein
MTSSILKVATTLPVVIGAVIGFGSPVLAQTSGTTGTTKTTGTTGAPTSVSTRAGSDAAVKPQSSAESSASAETIVARGGNLSQRVAQMLDEARGEADMIRVTCLNDKLTQINANLRTAQSRLATFQKAVDVDERNHELTVLTVLGQKLQVLDQESNQCVGQDLFETGPTKIQVEINTSLLPFEAEPGTPPTLLPPTVLGVPPDASANGV